LKIRPIQRFLFFSATALIFVYICSIGIRNVFRYNNFKQAYEQTASDLKYEQELHQLYKQEISEMNSQEYWELKARDRLGFIKKNEKVYIVTEKNP